MLDLIFLTVFVVEILLKWYHGFFLYWKSGWNVFDFIVVALSLLGPRKNYYNLFLYINVFLHNINIISFSPVVPLTGGDFAKLLRGFRAFRLLRSIRYTLFLK